MRKSLFLVLGLAITLPAADTKMAFTGLPAAVQAAAKAEAKGAEIVGAGKEVEKGRTTYEVETKKDGKSRDLSFDVKGTLLETEQQVDIDSVPPKAKSALQAKAAGVTIKKVECVTAGKSVSYEAAIVTKAGKHTEFAVNADGTPHRD